MIARLRALLKTAKNLGLNASLGFVANDGYANSPVNLRADSTVGHNGYHADMVLEQHHRLKYPGRRTRHVHDGLRHLPAHVSDRQNDARQRRAQRFSRPRNETMIAVKP